MKNNNSLVSVIMPVYNGEKYLREAIESILNQTYKNFEFIIVDDGSTDKSKEIIEEYAKKDKRIIFFENKKNKGLIYSLNKAIDLSKGDFIARMDADDISFFDRLKKQIDFFKENKDYVIVGSNLEIIDESSKKIGIRIYPKTDEKIRKIILIKSPFAHPSVMIRKRVFNKIKKYLSNYPTVEDYELWFRLLELGKGYNIQENLVKYRIHINQEKSKKLKIQLKNTIKLQRKYLFNKKYFSFLAFLNHIFLNILLLMPNRFVLWLFKKIEFRK